MATDQVLSRLDTIGQNIDFLSNSVHNGKMRSKKLTHNPDVFKNKGVFSLEGVKKLGISHQTLYRWIEQGKIQQVGRGTFLHSSSELPPEEYDYATACAKFGTQAAIGGLTALFKYGLIEQVPQQVWVVVPSNRKTSQGIYRCLRTTTKFKEGIENFGHYRITNIERTLLEALKFASKIGPRVAIHATRKAIQDGLTTEMKLGKLADKLKLRKVFEKYWEAIIS